MPTDPLPPTPLLTPPLSAFPAAWLKLIPLSVRRPDADVAC